MSRAGSCSGSARIGLADVRANATTIENVRLWDVEPLLQTFGQLQEIRTYYDFVSVDDDRYWIDGRYRQVLLSPRELNPASLPTRTFINEHLTFTHGMGLTLGAGNQATAEGLPVLFIKRPAAGARTSTSRSRGRRSTSASSPTPTSSPTRGSASSTTRLATRTSLPQYARHAAACRSAAFARRWLLATYFRSLKVLLSSDITTDSRALYHRNIAARARMALPFLLFDPDPYLVDRAPTARWSGSSTPTPRRAATPTRGRSPTARTTCATASRW